MVCLVFVLRYFWGLVVSAGCSLLFGGCLLLFCGCCGLIVLLACCGSLFTGFVSFTSLGFDCLLLIVVYCVGFDLVFIALLDGYVL